jgi:hypothetical protein
LIRDNVHSEDVEHNLSVLYFTGEWPLPLQFWKKVQEVLRGQEINCQKQACNHSLESKDLLFTSIGSFFHIFCGIQYDSRVLMKAYWQPSPSAFAINNFLVTSEVEEANSHRILIHIRCFCFFVLHFSFSFWTRRKESTSGRATQETKTVSRCEVIQNKKRK